MSKKLSNNDDNSKKSRRRMKTNMNKKIIIILTVILSLGGGSSIIAIYYHSKKQEFLKIKEKNKEEKKEKNKEEKKEKKKKKKKIVIPWIYTWKGEVCSLPICILASLIPSFVAGCKLSKKSYNEIDIRSVLAYCLIFYFSFFLIIFTLLSPFILAFKKFGKKSYFQRLLKAYSKCKIITSVIALIFIILFYASREKAVDMQFSSANLSEYLKIFLCCEFEDEFEDPWLKNYLLNHLLLFNNNFFNRC